MQDLNIDPFLTKVYDSLHDSPMQRKLKRLCPIPVGTVFLPWPGVTEVEIRSHFRKMRELGFNAIKQFMASSEWSISRLRELALDEGLVPWTYGEGIWEDPTPELLAKLGLPADMDLREARKHPKMVDYQRELMRERIRLQSMSNEEDVSRVDGRKLARSNPTACPKTMDETYHRNGPGIPAEHFDLYVNWLKDRYGSIDGLNEAWNVEHVGIGPRRFLNWQDLKERFDQLNPTEYRHILDELRFKADTSIARVKFDLDIFRRIDPDSPGRAGGEVGMFLPHPWWGIDMEGIAEVMKDGGSFYPSIHLAWHFDETLYEYVRPVYMQAAYTADIFKGGWAATWESTGGPQQFSGGKGPGGELAETISAFTVDEGTMTQLLLSYLAGGLKGVGLWTWNARTAGWEAGEYALLDRNKQVTPRAIRAGQIAQAADRYRDELWSARKEPLVGVFQDWDNDAMWTAISVSNRDQFKMWPSRARIGVSRALINANVPFEYVTAKNLRKGLAGRYRTIYLPAIVGLSEDLIPLLHAYVEEGGRLVIDAPGNWLDTYGRVPDTGIGSVFEQLFGATLDDFQYGTNVPYSVGGHPLDEFVTILTPTTGQVSRRRDDGKPFTVEHRLGRGSTCVIAASASLMAWRPGNAFIEDTMVTAALGGLKSPYRCQESIVYRLAGLEADHYFFVNDGPATVAALELDNLKYIAASDAVSGDEIKDLKAISVEANGGRWIRCQKA